MGTRAVGVRRDLVCWKWVDPLRDLWEGASLGGRELPWTRGKREKKRKRKGRRIKSKETRKEKREAKGGKEMLFCW